jgi:two-component system response regulator AtoC
MNLKLPSVLIVDDERNMRESLQTVLEAEDYSVCALESAEEAIKWLEAPGHECFMVITDARLGGMSGYDFLREAHQRWPDLPILIITAYATPKLAVEAIKAGAVDYLAKPFEPEELLHAVARCAERYRLLQENVALRARAAEPARLEQIIGNCPAMVELRRLIQMVARSQATVLILGESGTGKELIAGALHSLSPRSSKNYVRINCAAIPENLLESELFGHEKGAFTGAIRQKIGRVEEADGGTIFLDEIGDMSRPLQAKLLRFLEDGTFTRVGGNEEHKVDVRLIAATNRDIIEAIHQNQFREDLYHRLNVVQIRPPPLRERGEDVLLLARFFLKQFAEDMQKHISDISPAACQKLMAHRWPGNVRELRNVIERAVILESSSVIQAHNIPDFQLEQRLRRADSPRLQQGQGLEDALDEYERTLINHALELNRYSLTRTADYLKITRHALRYRIQRLNISLEDEPGEETRSDGREAGD